MNSRKTFLRICALVLAALLLSGCSAVISNPVVAQVGDVDVMYSQFASLFQAYASYGLMDVSTAEKIKEGHAMIFDQLVNAAMPIAAAHKQGITLTDEEKAKAMENIASTLDSYLAEFMDESITDEAARTDAAIKAFDQVYKAKGLTYAQIKDETEQGILDEALGNKLAEQVKSGAAVATDVEAKTWYDEQVKAERERYAKDPTAYNADKQYYTYSGSVQPLVAPEGLFYVKHILIKHEEDDEASEDDLSFSDSASFRDPQAIAQSVLDKVNEGADFDALVAEYGEDPGMEAEPAKSEGYIIGEGFDAVYDKAFYEAAIQLEQAGDTSGLVNGTHGYHIIRRVGDASTDPIPFEDVKEEILTYLNGVNQSNAYNAALEQWKSEITVKTYDERVSYVGVNR